MTAWILLRGLTREAGHWGDFPDVLVPALPGARIVAPDLPGNGRLHGEASPATVVRMAERCREALLRQGISPPYRLLALSLGAMVAVAWADAHPQEIAGAVLINTSLRPFSPWYRRLRPASYPTLLKLLLPGGDEEREAAIYRLTSRRPERRQAVLDAWVACRRERPVSAANGLRQLVAAARFRAPAAKPPVPLLVLASRGDELVDWRCSQRLADCWQVPIAVHPDAGHDLPLDDGPWVAAQVRSWLDRM